jgi:hypothetical protein
VKQMICEFCGKTFYVKPYREKRARFCSRSCCAKWEVKFLKFGVKTRFTSEKCKGNKFRVGRVPWNKGLKGIKLSPTPPPIMRGKANPKWKEPISLICKNCGRIFYKKPWELNRGRGSFCSTICRGEYFIKTGHLKRMAEKARKTPTKPEKRFIDLCERYRLPFRYVGDGHFWIGRVNPDFVWEDKKIAIEVMGKYHHSFFKLFKYGRMLPWFKTPLGRKEYLARYGWNAIILSDDFKEEDALKEVLKYCPLQRNLLRMAL